MLATRILHYLPPRSMTDARPSSVDSSNRPAGGQRGRDGGGFRPLDAGVRQDLVRHGRQLAHGLAAAALPAQPGAEALPDGRGRFAHVVFAAEGGSRLDIGSVAADVASQAVVELSPPLQRATVLQPAAQAAGGGGAPRPAAHGPSAPA